MRRYWPARLILAIIAFSVVIMAAPATAAPHSPAASQPYRGLVCRTVHSNVHDRTGVICAGIAVRGTRHHPKVRAIVLFKPSSGKLTCVSVGHLYLYVDGNRVRNESYSACGMVLAIPTRNMWDGDAGVARSGVWHACMYWTDGGHACTGPSWLFSKKVSF
jgi:hypothetical protein